MSQEEFDKKVKNNEFLEYAGVYGKSYGTTAVPNGWLVPLTYINIGRPSEPGDQIAKVNLIVPHTQGQYYASANVYPCLYNITYERGR